MFIKKVANRLAFTLSWYFRCVFILHLQTLQLFITNQRALDFLYKYLTKLKFSFTLNAHDATNQTISFCIDD